MTESEAISCLKADKEYLVDMKVCDGEEIDVAIKALEEVEQYRAIGTVDEIKFNMEELKRWHTDTINPKIKNVFANTSTLICHNCDHKNEYIEELEAEMEEYHAIGTPDECRAAVEKQKEMIAYCDENDCSDCPFHNTNSKYNKCMNDFIADEIVKGGGVNE